jgi:hypothetical protein
MKKTDLEVKYEELSLLNKENHFALESDSGGFSQEASREC